MNLPRAAIEGIIDVLNNLEIEFFFCGSLASSAHGLPRFTNDIDLLAAMREPHIEPFVQKLSTDFYVDGDMIRNALRHQRSFNLIHYSTSYKIDIFPYREDPFVQSEARRRIKRKVPLSGGDPIESYFASAEDTVLSKLSWYKSGNEISESQWKDVRGILDTQGKALDVEYLRSWSEYLGVTDLLERALEQSAGFG